MIRIGQTDIGKKKIVNEFIKSNEQINKIYCFYFKKFPIKFNTKIDIEYIEYSETEMYRTFYPLLERIDQNTLLIFNECMRTQNRSELKYNCMHHYVNQCGYKIVFEYFPIIDNKEDFMILLDLIDKQKYKGKSFQYSFLKDEDIIMKPRKVKLITDIFHTSYGQKEKYESEKEKLFKNLGMKNPDTVPRNLQILAGNFKLAKIDNEHMYIARNKRFNKENVTTYDNIENRKDYIIIDFHYRRIDFNDFVRRTGIEKVNYISTDLSIDEVLIKEFIQWNARLEAIYGQANLC